MERHTEHAVARGMQVGVAWVMQVGVARQVTDLNESEETGLVHR